MLFTMADNRELLCFVAASDLLLESLHQVTHCQLEAETYVKKVCFLLFVPLLSSNKHYIYCVRMFLYLYL